MNPILEGVLRKHNIGHIARIAQCPMLTRLDKGGYPCVRLHEGGHMAASLMLKCPLCGDPMLGTEKRHNPGKMRESVFISAQCSACSARFHFSDLSAMQPLKILSAVAEPKPCPTVPPVKPPAPPPVAVGSGQSSNQFFLRRR